MWVFSSVCCLVHFSGIRSSLSICPTTCSFPGKTHANPVKISVANLSHILFAIPGFVSDSCRMIFFFNIFPAITTGRDTYPPLQKITSILFFHRCRKHWITPTFTKITSRIFNKYSFIEGFLLIFHDTILRNFTLGNSLQASSSRLPRSPNHTSSSLLFLYSPCELICCISDLIGNTWPHVPPPAKAMRIKQNYTFKNDIQMIHKTILNPIASFFGRLAQLARAFARHAKGHRFESDIDHHETYKKSDILVRIFYYIKKIIDIIFPKKCLRCKRPWEYLCRECKKKLEPHPEICPVSHRFSPGFQVHVDHRNDVAYEWVVIWFAYTDLLKKLILQLKYHHRYDITSFLAWRLVLVIQTNQHLQKLFREKSIIFTSVPSHRYRKYFVKGYNQSELLAKRTAEILQCEYVSLLTKNRSTRAQVLLSRRQRHTNLHMAFSFTEGVLLQWNECIVIIDDITTTCSTIHEAAKVLKASYPSLSVRWAVLGRRM